MCIFLFAIILTHNMDPAKYDELRKMGNAKDFRKKYGYKEQKTRVGIRTTRIRDFDTGQTGSSVSHSSVPGWTGNDQAYPKTSYSHAAKSFRQISSTLATP